MSQNDKVSFKYYTTEPSRVFVDEFMLYNNLFGLNCSDGTQYIVRSADTQVLQWQFLCSVADKIAEANDYAAGCEVAKTYGLEVGNTFSLPLEGNTDVTYVVDKNNNTSTTKAEVVILDFKKDVIYNSSKTCGITFGLLRPTLSKHTYATSSGSYSYWTNSYAYQTLLPNIYKTFPQVLKNNIKQVYKYAGGTNDTHLSCSPACGLFLYSCNELSGIPKSLTTNNKSISIGDYDYFKYLNTNDSSFSSDIIWTRNDDRISPYYPIKASYSSGRFYFGATQPSNASNSLLYGFCI